MLTKRLSNAELKALARKDGYITVYVAVSLASLINGDIDDLNEAIDHKIVKEGGILSDINYTVVGHGEDNMIHLEVCADASAAISEE